MVSDKRINCYFFVVLFFSQCAALTCGSDTLSGSDSSSSGTDPSLSDSLQETNIEAEQTYILHPHLNNQCHNFIAIETG